MVRKGLAAILIALAVSPLCARAQTGELEKKVGEAVQIHQDTQVKQDAWEKEKAALTARYRTAKANVDYLLERKSAQERTLAGLEANVVELERRMKESVRLQSSLQDTLNTIVVRLEDWVKSDLPFLREERASRVASLKEEIRRPDVEGSEKLRRVLEALQVEAGYGSTVEVEQQEIQIGEERLFVDVLRVGRVSLFWRTPEGKRVGEFDRAAGRWVELPGKYRRNIRTAVEMAARLRNVDVVSLPLGRIEP
jgi:seryl-tRNA synthetase